MLRPEQMSKVSVTGAKSIMDDVIETMHDMQLVHITEYDGSWEGFEPGTPLEGSDESSSKLVTVRAIESTLDITEEDFAATETVDLSNADERLEEIRERVNELDDQRNELRTRLREIEERLDQLELFADLGLDLELLWGYDSLDVLVGEGDADAVDEALAAADEVEAYDVFGGNGTVATFGYMAEGEALSDTLVGVPFTEFEVPEETGDPASVVDKLGHERQQIQTDLQSVENELESLKLDTASFILALEEELSIDVQKFEAPLRFATTERSFIVEGWVPTDSYESFEEDIRSVVGDRVEVEELERASYTSGGHLHKEHHEDESAETESDADDSAATADANSTADEPSAEAETDQRVATDGGTALAADGGEDGVVTVEDDPPVIQNNPKLIGPFEVLVKAVNRPKYSELDPTILIFLTFPFFFGFMIGDIGYGIVYMLIGYYVASSFDSEGVSNFGLVVVWMGVFTTVFGLLYGELFGLHFFDQLGIDPALHKGLVEQEWAETWLVVAVLFGWIQLNIGYIFDFIEEFQIHGVKPAMMETGSWLLMLNGIWVWIFSYHSTGSKPAFLVGEEAVLAEKLHVPFTGFPELLGLVGLVAFAVGILLILAGPWFEVFEFLVPVVHVLSYTRLTAVLLSKAGMAVAANLLYFGAYRDEEGGFHFLHTHGVEYGKEHGDLVFGGISNMGTQIHAGPLSLGIEGALVGLPVLIIAHIVVLAIGGTAALQAIRLEYVEFFEKFYEGGGKNYQPFGYDRKHTTEA